MMRNLARKLVFLLFDTASQQCHIDFGTIFPSQSVCIGKQCIVSAGSVVTKNIPDYAIAVGNPARVIKTRNAKQTKEGTSGGLNV